MSGAAAGRRGAAAPTPFDHTDEFDRIHRL